LQTPGPSETPLGPEADLAPIPSLAAPSPLDAGIPGRTRPRFDELAPGPPTWPGWLCLVIGILALAVAIGVLSVQYTNASLVDALEAGLALLGGAVILLVGLVWLAVASIIRRRVLPPDRYRGPSIIILLFIVQLGGSLLAVPIVLAVGATTLDQVTSAALLLTPISFLLVALFFVGLPRALEGLRLWQGPRTVTTLGQGLVMGAIAWLAIQALSVLLALALKQLGINTGGEQQVVNVALQAPPAVSILAVGVLAPIAEEVFFRGVTFNAWEREYGTRWAIIGSAVLFALVHVPGGTWIVIPIIFVLGLVLALAYARTRSLGTTIGIHAIFNLTSLLILLLTAS
jgi:uncharacterized protein